MECLRCHGMDTGYVFIISLIFFTLFLVEVTQFISSLIFLFSDFILSGEEASIIELSILMVSIFLEDGF